MEGYDQEYEIGNKRMHLPDRKSASKRQEVEDGLRDDNAGDEQAHHHDQKTKRNALAENASRLPPPFRNNAIPAPVKDVVTDQQHEHKGTDNLVGCVSEPVIREGGQHQADREQIQNQTKEKKRLQGR